MLAAMTVGMLVAAWLVAHFGLRRTFVAALCVFVPQGEVVWGVGLSMGAANLAGGYLGARTAVRRGRRFVRLFFIVVVSAFIVRIGGDVLGLWG